MWYYRDHDQDAIETIIFIVSYRSRISDKDVLRLGSIMKIYSP